MGWATEVTKRIYIKKAQKEYKEYLEKYPDDLDKIIAIIRYEELHPEYVKTTNKFLSPLELKDKVEIKFIIYTADAPYRLLCLKYMNEFEIVSISESGVFNSGKNTLIFDVLEDRTNPRGKYYTFSTRWGMRLIIITLKTIETFLKTYSVVTFFRIILSMTENHCQNIMF